MTFDSWPSCLHLLRTGIPGLCTRLRPPHNVPCRFSQKKKKMFLKLVSIELNFSIGKYCFSFIMGRLTRRYMLGTFNLHPKNKRLFPLIYCHLFLSIKLQHSNLNSQIEMHYPNWQVWGELIHYVRCPVIFRLHSVSLETSWLFSCIFRVDGALGSHAEL